MILNELFKKSKKQIAEGGNLALPGGHEAQQIDLKVHNRSYIVPILDNLINSINNLYAQQYQAPLWDPKLLKQKTFLSGSSLHFFNTDISDEEFVAKKPKVGDIDTQVNKENEANLEKFLTANQNKVIGPAKLLGFQRGNEQFSSLWEFTDPPIKVQIDLEFVAFDEKGPTPWSQFSHSSSWEDLQAGIKGVFHKFLIQSFTTLTNRDFLLQKSVGRGANKTVQNVPTTDNMVSFAVSSKEGGGLRAKYAPVLDEKGNPVVIDGLPVMQPLPPAGYEQDLSKIFSTIFDTRVNSAQLKKLMPKTWSFTGLIDVMNLILDPEEKAQVVDGFVNKLFAKGAQGLYKNDPERDLAEKNAALNYMLKTLGMPAPKNLEQLRQEYRAGYKMTAEAMSENVDAPAFEAADTGTPDYKRQGIKHIYSPGSSTEMKDLEFVEMAKEIAQNNGTLDGMSVNLKADGAGIRFGKDESGKPFFMTSKVTEPKYIENYGDFEAFGKSQGQDEQRLAFTKNYDEALKTIVTSNFIKKLPDDTIVQAEMMYTPMAQETEQGLKFVNIPYDPAKLGKTMTLVPFMFKTYSTGQVHPQAEQIKKALLSSSNSNIKMVDNQLKQQGVDVSKIIDPVVNMDPQMLDALASRTRVNPLKDQAKEIITKARQELSNEIINNPKIAGKDQLGSNIEGLVINLPSGRLAKVTSQMMKDTMAAKRPKAGAVSAPGNKTAVVAIGSFVGHVGHEQLFDYTVKKAAEVGGDPYLFIGNAVGKDDPIPPDVKVQTWHKLHPEYAKNISATQSGGSLMQKIKHELINPLPGKPPRYDNVIIMVGEDQASMPIANALMKAVNKFPGYEHVKVSLEVTPRGTGMSFSKLRNVLKDPNATEQQQFALWSQAFDVNKLGASWIKHLMDITKKGMGIQQPQAPAPVAAPIAETRLLNALIRPGQINELDVSKTLNFATKAHQGQQYGEKPYITHPRSVAATGKKFFGAAFTPDAIKVALLHDVVEDTPYKLKQLAKMGYSPEVVQAVQLLTKNKALSYADNIKAIIASGNKLAMMVKYADNYQNFTGDKSSWDPERAAHSQKKYLASLDMLGDKLGVTKHLSQPEEQSVAEESNDVKSLQIELWNLYKDVTGFRPRPGTVDWTREQWDDPEFLKAKIAKLSGQDLAEGEICKHCQIDPCICDDSHGFVNEARMSAAVRMQRAADAQRAKSDASLRRTPSSIPKAEPKKDEKVAERRAVEPDPTGYQKDLLTSPKNALVIDTPGDLDWYKLGQHYPTLGADDPHEYGQGDSDMMIVPYSKQELVDLKQKLDRLMLRYKEIGGGHEQPEIHDKVEEKMLPKSAFAGANHNKLGSAGQWKNTGPSKNRPARAGDLVGGAQQESLKDSNPCWKGYHPVGTKKKSGKTVPNCVPVSENVENIMDSLINKIIVNEAIHNTKR